MVLTGKSETVVFEKQLRHMSPGKNFDNSLL